MYKRVYPYHYCNFPSSQLVNFSVPVLLQACGPSAPLVLERCRRAAADMRLAVRRGRDVAGVTSGLVKVVGRWLLGLIGVRGRVHVGVDLAIQSPALIGWDPMCVLRREDVLAGPPLAAGEEAPCQQTGQDSHHDDNGDGDDCALRQPARARRGGARAGRRAATARGCRATGRVGAA